MNMFIVEESSVNVAKACITASLVIAVVLVFLRRFLNGRQSRKIIPQFLACSSISHNDRITRKIMNKFGIKLKSMT